MACIFNIITYTFSHAIFFSTLIFIFYIFTNYNNYIYNQKNNLTHSNLNTSFLLLLLFY